MVFSSLEFIFIFLPAFLLLYGFSPPDYKNAVIFMCSIIFYGMGVKSPVYIILFILTLIFNYITAQFIDAYSKSKKIWLIIGIVFNFWWLLFFKYTGFTFVNINALFHTRLPVKDIILPIGISFYTFQNVSYITDVYRGKAKAEKNLINYGAYISMFPQLIAGPIVTYQSVAQQLRYRQHTISKVEDGLKTFTIGLGFKVLIANQLSGLWNDISMIGYESISTPLAWLGIIAYSFQLYFDFYGYSLMAIGLGKIMGFELPVNFDFPYLSLTMTEFWRRWHITLGSWFREYIYIPLGGNRKGRSRQIINTLAVWLFTGLWHGASWNFVLWGLVLFCLLILEKFVIGKFLNEHKAVGHCYMFLIIPLTWLIFAVTDFHELGIYFKRLFPFIPQEKNVVLDGDYLKYLKIYWKFFAAGILFSTRLPQTLYRRFRKNAVCAVVLLAVFWGAVYCMYKGMNDPFMYFRF